MTTDGALPPEGWAASVARQAFVGDWISRLPCPRAQIRTWPSGLSAWIAAFEISEPLGRRHDLLVPDEDGVRWWGDGYRDLSEHPDVSGDMQGWLRRRLAEQGSDQPSEVE